MWWEPNAHGCSFSLMPYIFSYTCGLSKKSRDFNCPCSTDEQNRFNRFQLVGFDAYAYIFDWLVLLWIAFGDSVSRFLFFIGQRVFNMSSQLIFVFFLWRIFSFVEGIFFKDALMSYILCLLFQFRVNPFEMRWVCVVRVSSFKFPN